MPARIATYTVEQLLLAVGFFAVLLTFAFLLTDRGVVDFGFGYYAMFLGSIALFVGTILFANERPR